MVKSMCWLNNQSIRVQIAMRDILVFFCVVFICLFTVGILGQD